MRRGRWRKQVVMSQIRKSEEGVYFFYFKTAWRVGWDSGVINITEREIDRRGLIFFLVNFTSVAMASHRLRRVLSGEYLKQAKNSVSLERCRQEGNTNNVIIHLLLIID